jgi:hypothetical protein
MRSALTLIEAAVAALRQADLQTATARLCDASRLIDSRSLDAIDRAILRQPLARMRTVLPAELRMTFDRMNPVRLRCSLGPTGDQARQIGMDP